MYYTQTDEHPVRVAGLKKPMRLLSDILYYEGNNTYLQICADDDNNIFVCYLYETDKDKLTQKYTVSRSFDGIYFYGDFTGHVNTHDKHIYYLFKPYKDLATSVYTMPLSDTPYTYEQCIEMPEDDLHVYVAQCKSNYVMELISGNRPQSIDNEKEIDE